MVSAHPVSWNYTHRCVVTKFLLHTCRTCHHVFQGLCGSRGARRTLRFAEFGICREVLLCARYSNVCDCIPLNPRYTMLLMRGTFQGRHHLHWRHSDSYGVGESKRPHAETSGCDSVKDVGRQTQNGGRRQFNVVKGRRARTRQAVKDKSDTNSQGLTSKDETSIQGQRARTRWAVKGRRAVQDVCMRVCVF